MQYVTIRVEGRVIVAVEDGLDLADACEAASECVGNADFGPYGEDNVGSFEDIDWHCVHVEDEDGRRTYVE